MSSPPKSTMNAAVDIASTIGHIDAVINLVIAGIVALILIIVGIICIVKGSALMGAFCIVIAFLLMLLAYLYYYFVTSSRAFAAVAGVAAVANVFGGGSPGTPTSKLQYLGCVPVHPRVTFAKHQHLNQA